jgi:hypothetical protein
MMRPTTARRFVVEAAVAVALLGAVVFASCLASCQSQAPNPVPKGMRLITGSLLQPMGEPVSLVQPGVQWVAVGATSKMAPVPSGCVDVTPTGSAWRVCLFFGEPFNAVAQTGGGTTVGDNFRLTVPCNVTVNLIIATLGSSDAHTPGQMMGLFSFATGYGPVTSELAAVDAAGCDEFPVVDLGTVHLHAASGGTVFPGANQILATGDAPGANPLAQTDTLGTGTTNLANPDDNGNGIPDANDPDEEGDGIPDAQETLTALLPDTNGDGVPDIFQ